MSNSKDKQNSNCDIQVQFECSESWENYVGWIKKLVCKMDGVYELLWQITVILV